MAEAQQVSTKDGVAELPDWVRSVSSLDLSRLADEFVKRIQPDPHEALALWDGALPFVPLPLQLAFGRLVGGRLDTIARAGLLECPRGHAFLFDRDLERRRRATIPLVPFYTPTLAYDNYAALVLSFGNAAARRALLQHKLVLLALRRESSTLAHVGLGSYDDQIVVLNGVAARGRASVFAACTEPGAQYSQRASFKTSKDPKAPKERVDDRYAGVSHRKSDGFDIDEDGIKDQGRLMAGTYEYFEKAGGFLGARAFQVKRTQQVERDTDGDGWFDEQDASRIDSQGAGTSMYIHRGGRQAGDSISTWSAGCQTIPGQIFDDFLRAVGQVSSFHYVLVDTVGA